MISTYIDWGDHVTKVSIGKLLRVSILLVAVALIINTVSYPEVKAQEVVRVYGYVFDEKGLPMPNSTVIVFNRQYYRVESVALTDEKGFYSMNVSGGGTYVIYAFHYVQYKGGKFKMDYVPAILDLSRLWEVFEIEANFTLYRAGYVLLEGKIYYVGGLTTEGLEIQILTPESRPISQILPAGEARIVTLINETKRSAGLVSCFNASVLMFFQIAERAGIIPKDLIHKKLALVPVNREVLVRVVSIVIDQRAMVVGVAKEYVIEPFSPDNPKVFKPDEVYKIDLTTESLKRAISLVREDISYTESILGEYESRGFYLAAEREELKIAENFVKEAMIAYGEGKWEQVVDKLERAFVKARRVIITRLEFMRAIAEEGASILPLFISTFAVSLAFYFFEEKRRKLMFFVLFYLVLLMVFAVSYPGFSLINQVLLILSVSASFFIVFFLIFVVPKYLREPEVPGKLSRGALVAVTFSMAKRYSRLRRSRTIITVFSLTALIWAFTVLASIATVYGYVETKEPFTPPIEGIFVKRMVNETELMPLGYYDYVWFLNRTEVVMVVPRVFADPLSNFSLVIKSPQGRVITLKGALGLSESEDKVTEISKIMYKGDFTEISEPLSIILPLDVATKLGVDVGSEVTVFFKRLAQSSSPFKFKVVGIFVPEKLDALRDVNNEPIKPIVYVKGKPAYANATDIAIFNWKTLLYKVFPEEKTGFSSIMGIYGLHVECRDVGVMGRLAREYIERKGPDYIVWFAYEGKCWKAKFGMRSESIFEREENIAFLVPLGIVSFNVIVSMYSIVHERRREIYIFNAIGFNPLQIAMIFLAESIVYGLLGGGIGYISGIVTFRAMSAFAARSGLVVREKLEWYWSVITVIIAIIVSMISSFKPALDAAFKYSPAIVRKHKIEVEEREKREEVFLRTTTGKTVGIPVKVEESEAPIFFSYLYTRLKDLSVGYTERTEEIEEYPEEEYPDGKRVKRFKFRYVFLTDETRYIIDNEVIATKLPKSDYYTIELASTPARGTQVPMKYIDRVAIIMRDIVKGWLSERRRLLGV